MDKLVEVFSILSISSLLIKAQLSLYIARSGTINANRRTHASLNKDLSKIWLRWGIGAVGIDWCISTDARLTLRWKNDTGFDKHMCNASISNKITEAFELLMETIWNIELKHRGLLLTNVLKLRNKLCYNATAGWAQLRIMDMRPSWHLPCLGFPLCCPAGKL